MGSDLSGLIGSFRDLEALVLGEAMLDAYLHGTADRLCREAPVPVVSLRREEDEPGGAANAAMNLAALGAQVSFLSAVGDDPEGRRLLRALEAGGLDASEVLVGQRRRTLTKTRLFAGSQMVARLDRGSTDDIDGELERRLIERLEQAHERCDVVVVSDYGYGTVTEGVREALRRLQRLSPRPLVVDSKYPERYVELEPTAVKPNYGEAIRLLGLAPRAEGRAEQLAPFESRLLELTGAQVVAATLDEEGAMVFERGSEAYRTYSQAVPHNQATGAGDTYTAALALALAAGAPTPTAAECASAAARVVIHKGGTTVCSEEELLGLLSAGDKVVPNAEALGALVGYLRQQGKRIVFTNGCFDILHRGHVTYLSRAKALGDVLVVGVNSDDSVRALKGSQRPINSLEDRLQVLSALSCVDHLVAFADPTPEALLRLAKPDVFAKGGDYSEDSLPEAPLVRRLGGRVEILPYVDDRSTTQIIERVRKAQPGADYTATQGGSA